MAPQIPTLDELKKQRKTTPNINIVHKESLTALERFAVWITEKIGSMGFFLIIFSWTFLWLIWNIIAPIEMRFDPFPAFVLWLFISNMIQLMLLPLLMIGQNLQGRHAEFRAEIDFETNLQAEQEIEIILKRLEKQEEMLNELLHKTKE